MKSFPVLAVLAFLARPLAAADAPRQVTIPLSEYEKITEQLKQTGERPSLTVVEMLRFGGSFRGAGLTVSFAGRSVGKLPALKVLHAPEDVSVFGCEGDGIVARSDEGGYALTPLAPKFDVRCRIAASGSDRLELSSTRGVLHVEAAVSDGEIVVAGGTGDGGQRFSIVRTSAATGETLPATASGRYRITLRPDETRFVWQIDAHNPNRARRPFDVTLRSGEHVQQVDATAPYEVVEGRYRFDLPPGDTTLTLSGVLDSKSFVPPVEASVQYVLVESDPLLRATVSGAGKRVSPNETGIAARFRGAQAFLLGKGERLAFATTKLETLHTTSFAIKSVRHLFYLPAEGSVIGESGFVIDNQGASEVMLPSQPQPTFASFQGEPVLLTKNAEGKLTLPLAHGVQQLFVQHRQEVSRRLGFASAALLPPQVAAPASTAGVEIRYPHEWVPLAESFAGQTRIHRPETGKLFATLLLALFTERALWFLGLPGWKRVVLALSLGIAALFVPAAAVALLLGDLAVTAILVVALVRRRALRLPGIGVLALAAFAVFLVFAFGNLSKQARYPAAARPAASYPAESDAGRSDGPAQAGVLAYERKAKNEARPMRAPQAPPAPADLEAYQGLPARVDIPAGETRTWFSREMLPGDAPRPIRLLAITSTLAFWLKALLLALAVWALVNERERLTAGLAERLAQAQPVPPPVPQA